jgi:DNA-binding NtrC family response regulator
METDRRVVVLSRDLFFGMRIRNALKQMGYATVLRKTETELADGLSESPAVLALIDFNTPVDWASVATTLASHTDVPVIAFGAHTDTDGFRRAREAGVTRVIANGAFSQQLPDLVKRYARDNA